MECFTCGQNCAGLRVKHVEGHSMYPGTFDFVVCGHCYGLMRKLACFWPENEYAD